MLGRNNNNDGGMGMKDMMKAMRSESGMRDLLLDSPFPGVIATWINHSRMDLKAIGQGVGVEMSVERMSEERAADILAKMVNGEPAPMLEVFNDLQARRSAVLKEVAEQDDIESLRGAKEAVSILPMGEIEESVTGGDGG